MLCIEILPRHAPVSWKPSETPCAWTSSTNLPRSSGRLTPPQLISKVTGGERGGNGVITRLVGLGAPAPTPGEDPAAWLAAALRRLNARPARHPGNHRYVFRLGRTRAERSSVSIALPGRPYPKRDRQPVQLALDLAA
jgi:hypothetical protein